MTEMVGGETGGSSGVAAEGAERMCPRPAGELRVAPLAARGLVIARMVERRLG